MAVSLFERKLIILRQFFYLLDAVLNQNVYLAAPILSHFQNRSDICPFLLSLIKLSFSVAVTRFTSALLKRKASCFRVRECYYQLL